MPFAIGLEPMAPQWLGVHQQVQRPAGTAIGDLHLQGLLPAAQGRGVYLYATLISALPLHMALAEIWLERRGYRQASSVALVLFSLAIISAQVLLLTGIAFAATLPVYGNDICRGM